MGADWATEDLERHGRAVLEALARHVRAARAGRGPVVRIPPPAQLAAHLGLPGVLAGPGEDALLEFLERYLDASTAMHHPAYAAHQVAVPDWPAALADLIHGVTNNGMAIYEMGPAATVVELAILDWMLERVGWPAGRRPGDPTGHPHGGGVLTHGGSLANLTALLAARAAAAPGAWRRGVPPGLVLLAPPSAHYSIGRAAGILGLGADAVQTLEVDGREVIRPDRIPAAVRRQRDAGRTVMALVASACATGTGLYDPLAEIAACCREAGVWLHVDGAHGASALLSRRERHRMAGVEGASSLVWDAHKMLRTSGLCAAVLVRDGATLEAAFQQEASYIFYGDAGGGVDLITRTVECTKAPLGLKLLLNLMVRGEEGVARYVEERYAAARRFHALIAARPEYEAPFTPQANIVCFRRQGSDDLQIRLREGLLRSGRHHISSTEVAGRRYLRLTLMGPATDETVLSDLLDTLDVLAADEAAGSASAS